MTADEEAGARLQSTLKRFAWLFNVRPMPVAAGLGHLLAPRERRAPLLTDAGVRLFVDPLSHLGREVLTTGTYEPDVVERFRAELRPGHDVLDIGANEGFFSVLAGSIVGPQGRVLAVEPQSRLQALIEVNAGLNSLTNVRVVRAAVGEEPGEVRMFLAPTLNHGASGIPKRSPFYFRRESVPVVTAQQLVERSAMQRFDFVKVDVEGFEPEVVRSLVPLLRDGAVTTLLLDYHAPVLAKRGVSPTDVDALLQQHGMRPDEPPSFSGYTLYRRS